MRREYFICHSCGEKVECSGEERPCQVLNGWLMVSRWEGPGVAKHYNFCSFTCLKTWTDTHVPQVPDVFLRAFEKKKD